MQVDTLAAFAAPKQINAGVLSVGVAIGSVAGARIAHAVPAAYLARMVAIALVLVGAVLAVRSGHNMATGW